MKVLLVKDVYKLGRAGDVKKVADGYGRNFLIPQGLAILATPSALLRVEKIRAQANTKRAVLNNELSGVAEILSKVVLTFPVKAGETGKLYGSVTHAMIEDAIKEKSGIEVNRRQLDFEPIRVLGTHTLKVRLTVDLIPELKVIVHREGEVLKIAETTGAVEEPVSGPKAVEETVSEPEAVEELELEPEALSEATEE